MKQTFKQNQLETLEHLYNKLYLALANDLNDLSKSKKHKAYYLFTVLYSEGWWAENNMSKVKKAVLDHSLNLIWERRDPDDRNDDNIHIYFLENEKGKFFIILVHDPHDWSAEADRPEIIPVKRNDYGMTRIHPLPRPVRRKLKTNRNKILTPQKS
jgi:hypothetical protein